jgi:hypothetical protein
MTGKSVKVSLELKNILKPILINHLKNKSEKKPIEGLAFFTTVHF